MQRAVAVPCSAQLNGVSLLIDPTISRPKLPHFAATTIELFMIFGCKDLRTGASEAKFDAEADFEVGLALAP